MVLTVKIIADIYLGHITNWNDSAIAQLNPHLKDYLPSQPLLVVYSPGASPFDEILSELLNTIPEYNQTVS